MTFYHFYTIYGGIFSAYTLGVMHGKGHTHWKNFAMALVTGAIWPVAVCYGIYATHFQKVERS